MIIKRLNEHYQYLIKSWETKYKTMNDQLSLEIKLLNHKLNSLEEFRIQKDDLMTKFDQQETDLKRQNQRPKEVLFKIERNHIIDKDRLKKRKISWCNCPMNFGNQMKYELRRMYEYNASSVKILN